MAPHRTAAGRKRPAPAVPAEWRNQATMLGLLQHRLPRIFEREWLPVAELQSWFDDALDKDDPRPSPTTLNKLARDIRVATNRYRNAQRDPVPLEQLKDVDPADELNKRLGKVHSDANRLMSSLCELEEFGAPGKYWNSEVSVPDVKIVLGQIGAVAMTPPPVKPPRGQPRAAWHELARKIAGLIRSALREAGYQGDLTATHDTSPVAVIGARAINRIREIGPAGFAAACASHKRDRRKKSEVKPDPVVEDLEEAIAKRNKVRKPYSAK